MKTDKELVIKSQYVRRVLFVSFECLVFVCLLLVCKRYGLWKHATVSSKTIPDTYMHETVFKFIYVPGFAVYQL